MPWPQDQWEALVSFCPGAKTLEEGGLLYIHLPSLKLPEGCQPPETEALLRPSRGPDGYNSRLFFATEITPAAKISTAALNWNGRGTSLFERVWHAFSRETPQNQTLMEALMHNLKALR